MTFLGADALTRRLVEAWTDVDAGAVFKKSMDDARHLPGGIQRVLALLPVPAETALTVVWLLLNIVFAYAFVTVLGVDNSERASATVADFSASKRLRSTSGEGDGKSGAGVREAPRLGAANPLVTLRTLYALFLGVLPVYVVFSGIFLKPFLFLILLSSVAVLYVPAGLMTGLAIAILSWSHSHVLAGVAGRGNTLRHECQKLRRGLATRASTIVLLYPFFQGPWLVELAPVR